MTVEPFMETVQEHVSCRDFEGFGGFPVTGTGMETGDRSFSELLAESRGISGGFQVFSRSNRNAKKEEVTDDHIFSGDYEREIRDSNRAGKISEESFSGGSQVFTDFKIDETAGNTDERRFSGDLRGGFAGITAERAIFCAFQRCTDVRSDCSAGKTVERSFSGGFGRNGAGEHADRAVSSGFLRSEGVLTDDSSVGQRFSAGFGRELQTANIDGKMNDRGFSGGFKKGTEVENENSDGKTDERSFSGDFHVQITNEQIFSGDFLSSENPAGKKANRRIPIDSPVLPELHSSNPDKRIHNFDICKFGAQKDEASTFGSHEFGFFDHGSESDGLNLNLSKIVHNQVLKIREEDSHLGEDIGEGGFSPTKEKLAFLHLSSHMNNVLSYSRPILPSPLGTKTAIGSFQ